uniref:U39-Liphistoxin-Lsp1a_1 n=1 Tax=Liphistius sp. SGP-2016 TaxID=1905180 RepID=A0A4Q8K7D5_9ARAC
MAYQLFIIAFSSVILGEWVSAATLRDQENSKPTQPRECAEEFRNWCRRSSFGQGSVSFSSDHHFNEERVRMSCRINSSGIKCSKDGLPWFQCFPNGTLLYKEKEVHEGESSVDDEMCQTWEKVHCISVSGNSISVSGGCNSLGGGSVFVSGGDGSVSVNGGSISLGGNEEDMEEFHEQMRQFQEQMSRFRDRMQSDMRNLQNSMRRFSH